MIKDDVWDEALKHVSDSGQFHMDELSFSPAKRNSVRKALEAMEDRGWVVQSDTPGVWEAGPNTQLICQSLDGEVQSSSSKTP